MLKKYIQRLAGGLMVLSSFWDEAVFRGLAVAGGVGGGEWDAA